MAIKFLIIDGAKGKEIISGYNKVYLAWKVQYDEWRDDTDQDFRELVNSYPDFTEYVEINTEIDLSGFTTVVRNRRPFALFSSCSKNEKTNTVFIKYMYDEKSKKKITLPFYIKEVKENRFVDMYYENSKKKIALPFYIKKENKFLE